MKTLTEKQIEIGKMAFKLAQILEKSPNLTFEQLEQAAIYYSDCSISRSEASAVASFVNCATDEIYHDFDKVVEAIEEYL